jgi:hypothetical protein
MPFSEGGLIPEMCMSCLTQKDNYEWEVSDMCRRTYEDASYRCEENLGDFYNWYYGKITQGCEYLQSKVGATSRRGGNSTSIQVSLFGQDAFGGHGETVGTAILFAGAAVLTAAIVLCCCKKNRAPRTVKDSSAYKVGLDSEIISTTEAMETIDSSQKSATELMKSATKQIKKSVHNTAQRVVDLTRSTSNAVEQRIADKDEVHQVDDTYQAMDEK